MRSLTIALFALMFASAAFSAAGCAPSRKGWTAILQRATPFPSEPEILEKARGLDPNHISGKDISDVLSRFPAPRVLSLNGSLPMTSIERFTEFLISMGYPEHRIRNPRNGSLSYSSYMNSRKIAGMIAWYYENEGMMPVLVGYSQGGMRVVQVLHELADAQRGTLAVWNPLTGVQERRTSIHDPLTGAETDLSELKLNFASSIAAGRLMRFFLIQWDMIGKLRVIPDSVKQFTGYYMPLDPIGTEFLGLSSLNEYRASGSASVRTVRLPPRINHLSVPMPDNLSSNPSVRAWIESYVPGMKEPGFTENGSPRNTGIVLAAELWFFLKKNWCDEIHRLIKAGYS